MYPNDQDSVTRKTGRVSKQRTVSKNNTDDFDFWLFLRTSSKRCGMIKYGH